MKNGDTQITLSLFCCRVSHYRIIGDVRPDMSLISIHWRRVKLERVSDYKTYMRRALRMCVTDLIAG
jgi:hypothetical protein